MPGFTKLWSETVTSSIWNEDDKTRIVWITMLAIVGPDGVVRASIGGLTHIARVSRDACEQAIAIFEAPDPDSRCMDNEGRRVRRVDGGFLILNYAKYREARSSDERSAYMSEYMREYRRKHPRKHVNVNVSLPLASLAQAEAEAEADKRVSEEKEGTGRKGKLAPPARKGAASPDELFFSEISRHYPDVDIQRELRKMDAWFLTPAARNRKKTRRFIIAWLNKCDAPMKTEANGTSHSGQWGAGNERVTPADI
jgi:hypothetical protein